MSTKNRATGLFYLLISGLFVFGCQSRSTNANDATDTSNVGTNGLSSVTGLTETNALAKLNAVNQNEIDAAMLAQRKNISGAAMDYAKMLEKEHADNMDRTKQLAGSLGISIGMNDEAQEIRNKGSEMMATLQAKEGQEFEDAYITAMINGHTEALTMLDNSINIVNNDSVQQHLEETRSHVATHLEKAKELQKKQPQVAQ